MRKYLNPAFHYSQLESYVSVFDSKSRLIVDLLRKNPSVQTGEEINIEPYLTNVVLDILGSKIL